jgi:hypothetical protein
VYRRYASTNCLAVTDGALSVGTFPGEANGDNSIQQRVPRVICSQEFLRSEFQEQQGDDYQRNHQNRFE